MNFYNSVVHVSLVLCVVEMHVLFDTLNVVSAVGVCAREWTVAQVTLVNLFVVMNENMFQQYVC